MNRRTFLHTSLLSAASLAVGGEAFAKTATQRHLVVGVGGCGIRQTAAIFDELARADGYKRNARKPSHSDAFYMSYGSKQWYGRAVLLDTELSALEGISVSAASGPLGSVRKAFRSGGTGGNWAKGTYGVGAEFLAKALRETRFMFESMNEPEVQNVWFVGALTGGTGGALIPKLIEKLKGKPPFTRSRFGVFGYVGPTPGVTPLWAYNQCLALDALDGVADAVVLFEQGPSMFSKNHGFGPNHSSRGAANLKVARAFEIGTRPMREGGMGLRDLWSVQHPMKALTLLAGHDVKELVSDQIKSHRMNRFNLTGGKMFGGLVVAAHESDQTRESALAEKSLGWVRDAKGGEPRVEFAKAKKATKGAAIWASHSGLIGTLADAHTNASQMFKRRAYVQALTAEGLPEADLRDALARTKRRLEAMSGAASKARLYQAAPSKAAVKKKGKK